MIYLNPAGLSPFHPEVQQAMTRTLAAFGQLLYSDAGIQHYRETFQHCRQIIADWLKIHDEQQVAFMPNATTACNLTLSRINWRKGDVLLTTTHENSTILFEIEILRTHGIRIISLDPDASSDLLPALEGILREQPVRAIILSHVSHLDGRIFPIAPIQELAQSHHALLIVDGAQAVGHIPISFEQFHPHAYFFPGHKWCAGPMGTGALIVGDQYGETIPQGNGGEDPQKAHPRWAGYELGTQNIGLIAGLAKACDIKRQEEKNRQISDQIREEWKDCLRQYPGIGILEWEGAHAPGILSFVCLDKKTEQLMRMTASTHSLAWKTFTHPSFPSCLSIRVSWTVNTPKTELRSALDCINELSKYT